MKIPDKYWALAASAFCFGFGLATCEFNQFMSGFFAGMAAVVSFYIWMDED